VTYSDGFDGLPVPSPDGKRLAWTSSRAGAGAGQIFVADWNHEKALEALRNAPLRRSAAAGQDLAARIKAHVMTLASDAYAGRATGSAGEQRASDNIVSQQRRIGARPLPGRGDYRDRFEFAAGAHDGGSSIAVSSSPSGGKATTFDARTDVQALSISDDGTVSGPLVFAGYGIVLPQNGDAGYDSYASLDVKNKIVVVLRYFPERADRKTKTALARYSNLRYKATVARQRGAKAMIVITGPESPNAGETVPMTFDSAIAGSGIVAVSVSASVARTLFAGSRASLEEMQRALDSGDPNVRGFELPGITVSVKSAVVREKRTASNVLAYLPATIAAKPAEKPWIAIGAHFDHLGHGESGNSLAGKGEAGEIHHGADDNASGVAAVLAAAETLASQPRPRDVLLAFWSGEEIGLLGSSAFVRTSSMRPDQLSAYLNLDMVGRMQDNKLVVQATGTSASWPAILEEVNGGAKFNLVLQGDPYQPTDVATFNEAKVPTLNFFTGGHADYHRPSDTADKIDYPDLARVAEFVAALAARISRLEPPPAFAKVEQRVASGESRAGVRVSTGTIPDYTANAKGLLVGGVIAGGPADKAGLQKGDLIIELAGQNITNIYDYTYILGALKAGEPAAVVYMRDGQRKESTITPTARQ
jgi:Zn-dependent M28 family amino/carboxypeptidase